jgi:hypothetical protein
LKLDKVAPYQKKNFCTPHGFPSCNDLDYEARLERVYAQVRIFASAYGNNPGTSHAGVGNGVFGSETRTEGGLQQFKEIRRGSIAGIWGRQSVSRAQLGLAERSQQKKEGGRPDKPGGNAGQRFARTRPN